MKMLKQMAFIFSLTLIALACKKPLGDDCINPLQKNTKIGCQEIYAPVCGCDGETYSNECEAYYYGGVKKWSSGPCEKDDCYGPKNQMNCPYNIDYVCGCDGITYNNSCEAERNGIMKWNKGACLGMPNNSDCIDPSKVDLTLLCNENIDFVCGCDNVTYNNECVAKRNGVTKWTSGACKTTQNNPKKTVKKIELCEGQCTTLTTPRYFIMQSYPSPSYEYVWTPTSGLSCATCANPEVCPEEDITYTVEIYLLEYKIAKKGGNGIMPGGCVPGQVTLASRSHLETIEYNIQVAPCK